MEGEMGEELQEMVLRQKQPVWWYESLFMLWW